MGYVSYVFWSDTNAAAPVSTCVVLTWSNGHHHYMQIFFQSSQLFKSAKFKHEQDSTRLKSGLKTPQLEFTLSIFIKRLLKKQKQINT